MFKIVKNNFGNFLFKSFIFLLVFVWIFSGWPRIWKSPSIPPEVQQVKAATATKTFTFATSAEGFTGTSGGKSNLTYDSGVGNPAGSLKTDSAGRNNLDTSDWTWTGTWEDLGIPAGSTVTQIRLDGGYTKVTAWNVVDSVTIGPYKLKDSGGVDQATLWNGRTPTGTDSDWVAISAQTDQNVPSALQASNSTIKLYLERTIDLGNNKNAQATFYEDQLSFVITYTPPTTTLGDGTDPENSTVAPGSTNQYLDQFTFVTDAGTNSVTALTVTTTNYTAIESMEIWDDSLTTQYFTTVSNPGSNTWNFSGGTPIPVSTTPASFRIIFTAKSHADLASGTYPVTGTVTSFTCTNNTAGADTDSATITIDNSPPSDATWGTITPSDTQIELNWTNPGDADFNKVLILRNTAPITDAPIDGTEYTQGETIGTSTVRYVGNLQTFTDTGLTNGTNYYYKIFAYDNYINYAAGSETGPHTPIAIQLVQQKDARNEYRSPNTPGSVTVTLDSPATAGNLLVTGVSIDKASGTITPPTGFTLIHKGEGGVSSGAMAYKIAEGGEQTITWNWTATEEGNAWVGEYSGLATSNVLDVSAENEDYLSTATNSISTGTTGTTSQANELAIAMFMSDSGNSVGSSRSWTNDFTSIFEEPVPAEIGNPFLAVATKTLSSTGTVETTVSHDGSDESYACIATFKVATENQPPTVDSISISPSPIDLNADSTKTVTITATISDADGCEDVFTDGSISGVFYDAGVETDTCDADDNDCYQNLTFTEVGDTCSGAGDTTGEAQATVDVWFIANASSQWTAKVTATDSQSQSGSNTQTVTINELAAFKLDVSSIDYGTVNPDEVSAEKSVKITTTGNVAVDVKLSGDDLTYSSYTIPVGQQKYSSTSGFDWETQGTALTTTPTCYELSTGKPTAHPSNQSEYIYWKLKVPLDKPAENYSGNNHFDVVSDSSCP